MTETFLHVTRPARIGIIRFSALGDIVHTLPAFSLLRHTWPDSRITWFVHPAGARLLEEAEGLDAIEVVVLKGASLQHRLRGLYRILKKYRNKLDLIIDFQGLIKSAVFSRLLGGPAIGFAKADLREHLAGLFYSKQATPFTGVHVIDRNLHLLSVLGIQPQGIPDYGLRVVPPEADCPLTGLLPAERLPLALINLGGSWPSKRYDADFWVTFLQHLSPTLHPLLIWGSPIEEQLAREITTRLPVSVSPFLTFSQLIWLISRASLLVSSDSLALQLADALKIPSLGLFGPTNPARNGSRLPQSRSIRADVTCGYCYKRTCDKMDCRQKLSPVQAARLANEVVEQHD